MLARILMLLMLALGLSAPASAQQIFGSVYTGAAGPASLYQVSPASGAATLIGPIGFNRVGSIAFSPITRTLYGVGSNGADSVLIRIDPATGAGTLIGAFGVASVATTDIAFRNDGTLFALTGGNIYTINLATGAATLVGPVNFSFSGNALTFVDSQLLLGNTNGGTNGSLQFVNQVNATVSPKVNFTYGAGFNTGNGPRPAAMKYSTATRVIYASVFEGFPATVDYLAAIDPVTGDVTMIGATTLGMDGLAVLDPLQVPTLSDGLLVVVALVLLVIGMRRVRLRDTAV